MTEPTTSAVARALDAIDAANAADPQRIEHAGRSWPKELLHARLATQWVERLVARPGAALRLAARAHHLERWRWPRADFPQGPAGYHRWRRALQERHAERTAELMRASGCDEALVARVGELICKRGLGSDPEVQALEDALCLVFVETQLADFARQHDEEKLLDILVKSLRKMSAAGRAAVGTLDLSLAARDLLARSVERLNALR